jgi:hypothetical protein
MSPSVELQEAEPQPVAPGLLAHLMGERKHVRRNVETDRPGGLNGYLTGSCTGRSRRLSHQAWPAM